VAPRSPSGGDGGGGEEEEEEEEKKKQRRANFGLQQVAGGAEEQEAGRFIFISIGRRFVGRERERERERDELKFGQDEPRRVSNAVGQLQGSCSAGRRGAHTKKRDACGQSSWAAVEHWPLGLAALRRPSVP